MGAKIQISLRLPDRHLTWRAVKVQLFLVDVKTVRQIAQIFVTFSEKLNFKKVEMGLNTQKRQRQDKRHTLNIIRLGQVKHKNQVIT